MDIPIEPTIVSFSVVKLTYEITHLVPNSYCYINAYLTESGGNRLKRYELFLAGNDYAQWGQDDSYLTNWICSQCGVRQYVPPPPVPVETVAPVPVETVAPTEETAPAEETVPEETVPAETMAPVPAETMAPAEETAPAETVVPAEETVAPSETVVPAEEAVAPSETTQV